MSSLEKKKKRLLNKPTDYTENEFESLLKSLGFHLDKRKGGRVKYSDKKGNIFKYHSPHQTGTFKDYTIIEFIKNLKAWKYL